MPKNCFKGFNEYKIMGDYTIIYIPYKKTVIETIIDTEDLDKLIKANYPWNVSLYRHTKTFYVRTTINLKGFKTRSITLSLHSFLMGVKYGDKIYVDHINHNSLDNRRKENLRIADNSSNTENRRNKNSNNQSGYRNVSKVKTKDGYVFRVQLRIDGKNRQFGDFKDPKDAGKKAEEMRRLYYGEFKGNG